MKSKKGFTLLELMLSIAIILMISGLLVGLIVAIKDAYMTVYNQNDSADYALLQARTFEQSFLGNAFNGDNDASFEYTIKDNQLNCNNTPIVVFNQMKTQGGAKDKWSIVMGFKYEDTTNLVRYRVCMYDNYYNPGKLAYIIEGGFLLPHYDREITISGSNIGSGYCNTIKII